MLKFKKISVCRIQNKKFNVLKTKSTLILNNQGCLIIYLDNSFFNFSFESSNFFDSS